MEGTASVCDDSADDDASIQTVGPGSLVKVKDGCTLKWSLDSEEILILTPDVNW
eukprot:CAMPEP_0197868586 /NCGR_PEP_ID=MMETSP1438-20131217/45366_1 /TAXON_ID=1461541 /ORGANISM="Pterosperma sp., Strain CCMP1384" /LENGTH=53 /DNA_ID=CAMNT_0043487303 /DNA_START=416 /DNA_END=574 /DNA_ORIENTATION=-